MVHVTTLEHLHLVIMAHAFKADCAPFCFWTWKWLLRLVVIAIYTWSYLSKIFVFALFVFFVTVFLAFSYKTAALGIKLFKWFYVDLIVGNDIILVKSMLINAFVFVFFSWISFLRFVPKLIKKLFDIFLEHPRNRFNLHNGKSFWNKSYLLL